MVKIKNEIVQQEVSFPQVCGKDNIYKVGITSENLGDKRIYDVAKDAGFTPEIVMLENVGTVMAKKIESQILKLGKPVSHKSNFPGSSEFRHFSSSDLNKAIELIKASN